MDPELPALQPLQTVLLGFPAVSAWTSLSSKCFASARHRSVKIPIASSELRPRGLLGVFPELPPGTPLVLHPSSWCLLASIQHQLHPGWEGFVTMAEGQGVPGTSITRSSCLAKGLT